MQEKTVLYEINDRTAIITLNRPAALNTMNKDLIGELLVALNKAASDNDACCVVLTGAGRAFCAGGDLSFMETLTSKYERKAFIETVGKVPKTILGMTKPVIAMVNGAAAGAGFNLALACDLVFASESAKFAQSFAKVGLIPDCGGLYLLPRLVGSHKAKELMYTAQTLTAKECLALGLVNHVVPDTELTGQVLDFANALARSAPKALSLTKQALNNAEATLDDILAFEAEQQSMLLGSADYLEGVAAFKEKRSPRFTGK